MKPYTTENRDLQKNTKNKPRTKTNKIKKTGQKALKLEQVMAY